MANRELFHFIQTPESAVRWRNFLLTVAVPGAIWLLYNSIDGYFLSKELLTLYDPSYESLEKVHLAIREVVVPFLATYVPLKLSEYAHGRFRQLDPNTPPAGPAERYFYDGLFT